MKVAMGIDGCWTGMKEWKIRQEVYHRLTTDFKDDLNSVDIVLTNNVKEDALRHFYERIDQWLYPAKSYFVAYCYAAWISTEFNESFWQILNDENLLYGNDPYFKTYDEDPEIYNFLYNKIGMKVPMTGMVPDVREYYDAEFGTI